MSVNWFIVSCYVLIVLFFCSGLKVQYSMVFYVSSFMFLVLLKNLAFNAVLCFSFLCFVSSFMFLKVLVKPKN